MVESPEQPRVPGTQDGIEPGPSPTGAVKRVLVVDDEDAVRHVVAQSIDRMGLCPVEAPGAQAALDAFAADTASFAMAIVDFRLPGMDGLELIRRFRAVRADLPVVLMTGYFQPDPRMKAYKDLHILQKPFSLTALREELRSILEL
jgi:DNA-binding NtrC family response regulator